MGRSPKNNVLFPKSDRKRRAIEDFYLRQPINRGWMPSERCLISEFGSEDELLDDVSYNDIVINRMQVRIFFSKLKSNIVSAWTDEAMAVSGQGQRPRKKPRGHVVEKYRDSIRYREFVAELERNEMSLI